MEHVQVQQCCGDVKLSLKWGVHLRMSNLGFKICEHIILIMKQGKHRHFGIGRHKFKSQLVRPSPLIKVIQTKGIWRHFRSDVSLVTIQLSFYIGQRHIHACPANYAINNFWIVFSLFIFSVLWVHWQDILFRIFVVD